MPKGSVLATDNFNRANGGLGTNWTTVTGQGAPQISTNRVRTNAVGTDSRAYYNAVTCPADQYSEIVTVTAGASTGRGVVVRAQAGANSFYNAQHNGNFASALFRIHRYDAGTATLLSNASKTFAANDKVRMEIEGSTLRAYIADVLQYGPTTDSTYSTGIFGLMVYVDSGTTADAELDNWEGGSLAGAAVAHRLALMGVGG